MAKPTADAMSFPYRSLSPETDLSSVIKLPARQEAELNRVTGVAEPKSVAVPLTQFTRLLMDAAENNRAWLNDFADDLIRIDSDLYDVLLAYQSLRDPVSTS